MINERSDRVTAFLRDHGEATTQELCVFLGYPWPAQLEQARGVLIGLERRRVIVKTVRPTRETRVSYYSLPNGDGGGAT
jgi:hypothetical protein